jgi:hypothetical protein
MNTNNKGFLNNTQLDLSSYKESLKQYLRQQEQFKDFDFEGSNLSVFLDILAFNTYHNALYLNMIGSEMFLDTAQIRESLVSHAKELNYLPRSRSSAMINVQLQVIPEDAPETIAIPRNYPITGVNDDGLSYAFSTNEPIVLRRQENYTKEIEFFEGTIDQEAFVLDIGKRVILSSANVDVSSIQVEISENDAPRKVWNRADSIIGLDGSEEVFFLQAVEGFKYEIVFGRGSIGQQPAPGSIVFVTYRSTLGDAGNGIREFSTVEDIETYDNIVLTINPDDFAFGGSLHEDSEEIRFNSARYFPTQERAITESDFTILLKKQFPSLETIVAFGGERLTPPKFGKVAISAKPFNKQFIPESLKTQMLSYLRTKTSLSIDPIIIDPDYLFLSIRSRVKYNINQTTKSVRELETEFLDAVLTFGTESLSEFGSDFRFSRLSNVIDEFDSSIISNETRVLISRRIPVRPGILINEAWDFENELFRNGTTITSSPFLFAGFTSFIEDDGLGTLQIFTFRGGNKIILEPSIGFVDYESGEVKISNLRIDGVPEGAFSALKIFAATKEFDIETQTNKILLITPEDVSVSFIGLRE